MENTEKNLPAPDLDDQPDDFNDPEFDAAISKHLRDALEAHDAVPEEGGARFLTVEITLAEYRQLCKDAGSNSGDGMRYWELKSHYEADIARLTEQNRRLTDELAAIARQSRKEEH